MNKTINDPITITTLGASGSGKTCFLVGMYSVMRAGVRGFTFSAEDLDDDLKLSDWWEQMLNEQGQNRWPPPNDNNPWKYKFELCYALNSWKKFTWLDYRGSALRDKKDVADVKLLQDYFSNSETVFLCVPANQLADGQKDSSIGRMTQYLSDLRSSRMQPNIVITITKSDLLVSKLKSNEIIQRVKQWFEPLFVSGGNWTVMICPVTLGTELAKNTGTGAIRPRNVHLPISFAVYQRLGLELEVVKSQKLKTETQSSNKGFSFPWQKKKAEDAGNMTKNDWDDFILDIEDKMELLKEELFGEETYIYFDGKRIQFDV